MERALRVVSVERGYDPREFALVAFGGAGGLHACELAEALAIPTVDYSGIARMVYFVGYLSRTFDNGWSLESKKIRRCYRRQTVGRTIGTDLGRGASFPVQPNSGNVCN